MRIIKSGRDRRRKEKSRLYIGSLTVEATLLLMVCLTVYLIFLSFFEILHVELLLTSAAAEAVQDTADAGYLLKHMDEYLEASAEQKQSEVGAEEIFTGAKELEGYVQETAKQLVYGRASELWFQQAVKARLSNEALVERVVKGGYNGISFSGSEIYAEDELTVVKMIYQIKLPVMDILLPEIRFQKSVLVRSFSGEGSIWEALPETEFGSETATETESDLETGYVFVTENGTVFHCNRNCTYIRVHVRKVSFSKVAQERNRYGAKYYPCESCMRSGKTAENVWIAESGNRYHSTESCSRLKRTVTKIKKSEATGYRACSRCGFEE